jgi:hypothetical protein
VSPEKPKHHRDIINPANPNTTQNPNTPIKTQPVGSIESTSDLLPLVTAERVPSIDLVAVAGAVGVMVPSAFVDAGGAFGGGAAGIFPVFALGTSVALAGADSGIYLYLYFTEEFQSRQSNFFFGQYWRRRSCAAGSSENMTRHAAHL